MAVLGVQIVITMVMASLMSKIAPFYSFSRWLLTSRPHLVRYLHPSDEEIKEAAGIPLNLNLNLNLNNKANGGSGKNNRRGRRRNHKQLEEATAENTVDKFNVPRNTEIQLETSSVQVIDIVQLKFYTEYQWLVDFALYAGVVYVMTEVYANYFPDKAGQEVNLGMVWCVLVAGFAYRLLVTLNALYFKGEEAGERSLVIVMGCAYLFLAMLILIVDERTLETGLDEAYSSFNKSASAFLVDNAGLDSAGPASKLVLKFFIALWCASVGALFTFPGLRMARMHWDMLKVAENSGGWFNTGPVLLHASFVAPLLLTTLWVRPLSRDYLTDRVFRGMEKPFLTSDQFETLRLYLIIFVILFRVVMMKKYLQTYLDTAYYKMEAMKQDAGKISNLDLQRLIAYVFYYLCVVTLQYLAPMILILFLTLMYKTMGGGSWTGLWSDVAVVAPVVAESVLPEDVKMEMVPEAVVEGMLPTEVPMDETIKAVTGQFSLAWQSLKHVFNPAVFRGLLGFSTWWCCLVWFLSSGIGVFYQSYFAKV